MNKCLCYLQLKCSLSYIAVHWITSLSPICKNVKTWLVFQNITTSQLPFSYASEYWYSTKAIEVNAGTVQKPLKWIHVRYKSYWSKYWYSIKAIEIYTDTVRKLLKWILVKYISHGIKYWYSTKAIEVNTSTAQSLWCE